MARIYDLNKDGLPPHEREAWLWGALAGLLGSRENADLEAKRAAFLGDYYRLPFYPAAAQAELARRARLEAET